MILPISLLQRFAQSNHDPVIQGLLARFGQSGPPSQLDPTGGGGSYGGPQVQEQAPPSPPPMMTPPMQQAPMMAPMAPPQHVGLLDRIFGGGGEQVPGAGRSGLLDAGIAMLANSRANRVGEFAPSVGQALAAGLDAGRASYGHASSRQTWEHLNRVIGDPNSTPAQRRAAIFRALPFAPGQQADVLNRMLQQDTPSHPTVVGAGGSVLLPNGTFMTAPDRPHIFAPGSSIQNPDGTFTTAPVQSRVTQVHGPDGMVWNHDSVAGTMTPAIDPNTGQQVNVGVQPTPTTYLPIVGASGTPTYGAAPMRGSGPIRDTGVAIGDRTGGKVALPERQIRQSADLFGEMIGKMQALARRDPVAAQVDWNSVAGEVVAGSSSRAQGLRGKVSQGLAVAGLTPNQRLYRQYLRTAVDHYLGALRIRATNQVMDDLRGSLAPQLGQGREALGPLTEVQNALVRRTHETAYGAGSPRTGADTTTPDAPDPGVAAADDFLRRRQAAGGRQP